MLNSTNPFYEQYGLTRVREAMKRPFDEAFPVGVAGPAPVPPVVPQLRTHLPATMPRGMGLSTLIDESPAKRQRVEQANTPQSAHPSCSILSSLPVLAMRSPINGTTMLSAPQSTQSKAGAVSENYSVEGVTDEDLVQCVECLGLEESSGMSLMRHIFIRGIHGYSLEDWAGNMKASLSLLKLIVEDKDQRVKNIPPLLLSKLIASMSIFLNAAHNLFRHESKSYQILLNKLVMKILNQYPSASTLIKKYGIIDFADDYRFLGGKNKFEFILWCNKNEIYLTDSEVDTLISRKFKNNNPLIYSIIKDKKKPEMKS